MKRKQRLGDISASSVLSWFFRSVLSWFFRSVLSWFFRSVLSWFFRSVPPSSSPLQHGVSHSNFRFKFFLIQPPFPSSRFLYFFVSIALRRRIYFLLSLLISNPFYLDYDLSEKNKKEEMILLPFQSILSLLSLLSFRSFPIELIYLNFNPQSQPLLSSILSSHHFCSGKICLVLSLSHTNTHTLIPLPLLQGRKNCNKENCVRVTKKDAFRTKDAR